MKPFPSFRPLLPVAALCAAAVMVGSTGGAVAGALVTGAHIKDGDITGKDVKDGSLVSRDLSAGAVEAMTGPTGPVGQPGSPGSVGAQGAQGPRGQIGQPGLTGHQVVIGSIGAPKDTPATAVATCPEGKVVMAANGWLNGSRAPVQVYIDGRAGFATTLGAQEDDRINVRSVCGFGNR